MGTPIKTEKLAYSVAEAANAIGISKTAMYKLIHTEGFPVLILGNRRLIPVESFKRWLDKNAGIGCQAN